jgi:hypothetical protein
MKNKLSGFETCYKSLFITDFVVVIIPIASQKLNRTKGFSFADKSPGTDSTYAA